MRPACAVASKVLDEVSAFITPGVTTREVDLYAAARIKHYGAQSAFLGYRKYPCNICISINDEVVHGLANDRRLQFGDLVSLDVGVVFGGYVGDTARTVAAGGCSLEAQRLLDVTERALDEGIGQAIACAFAAEGAHVVVADVDTAASVTAASIAASGGSALAVQTDVTSPEAQDRLFARVAERFQRLDVLVNNAGIFHVAPLLDFPLEAWRRVFAVNLDGALLATQRAGRMMQAQDPHPVTTCRGKILNIS